jgi:hypothetical protein
MKMQKQLPWLALVAVMSGSAAVRADVVGTFVSGGFISGTFKGVAGQSSIGISSDGTQQRGLILADDFSPSVSISTPANKQTLSFNAFTSITGTATDNIGVTEVLVKLFRTREGVVQYRHRTRSAARHSR